jgi:lysyl oxidase
MKKWPFFTLLLVGATILGTTTQAQRTSVAREFPIYPNAGNPDLTLEGAVGGPGYRRLLRFDTVVINAGDGDLVIGDPSDPNNPYAPYFEFSTCHGHYHIQGFAEYSLLTRDGSVVVAGHRQGFCFEDSFKYSDNRSNGYDCAFQGITVGATSTTNSSLASGSTSPASRKVTTSSASPSTCSGCSRRVRIVTRTWPKS